MAEEKPILITPLENFHLGATIFTILTKQTGLNVLHKDFSISLRTVIVVALSIFYFVSSTYSFFRNRGEVYMLMEIYCANGVAIPVRDIAQLYFLCI